MSQCQYLDPQGNPCNSAIAPCASSYTGWEHQQGYGWQHFATPELHTFGSQVDQFVPCAVCGKKPDDNPLHFMNNGHRYIAERTT